MDQRLRGLTQDGVLHPQPLKLAMKPPDFGAEVGIHGLKLTVIRSMGHDEGPCRMPRGRG